MQCDLFALVKVLIVDELKDKKISTDGLNYRNNGFEKQKTSNGFDEFNKNKDIL